MILILNFKNLCSVVIFIFKIIKLGDFAHLWLQVAFNFLPFLTPVTTPPLHTTVTP